MNSGQHRLLLIGIILIQISGFVLLWLKIPPPAGQAANSAPAPVISIDPGSAMGAMKLVEEKMLRESIQEVLRQELQARQAPATRSERNRPTRPRETAMDSPLPEADPQTIARINAIVDRAVSAGVWTNNDNSALLQLAPQLSQTQRVQVLEKIFGAINRQQMKATGALPSL